MSTYVREKVLRIPFEQCKDHFRFLDLLNEEDGYNVISIHKPELFGWGDIGKFQFAPTDTTFVDYVLDYEYDCDGEYGKTRALYPSEQVKYHNKFLEIFDFIDMTQVRLVEFCWYNGTEAPDYYDETRDPFYDEV